MPALGTMTITIHGEPIRVRPTLHVAHTLHEKHGDIGALVMRAFNGSISAIMDMVREGASDLLSAERFERVQSMPLHGWHTPAVTKFVETFTPALLCIDLDALAGEPPRSIEPTPYNRVLADLFSKATGWLGWSPEEAWHATPLEILTAVNAHVEKLELMAGSSADGEDTADELDVAGLAELATMNTLC